MNTNTQGEDRGWFKWVTLEALARTVSTSIHRHASTLTSTTGHAFLISAVIGVVQVIGASIEIRRTGGSLLSTTTTKQLVLALIFGTLAFTTTTLGVFAFANGASLVLHVFFMSLSIVPGALIDRLFFGERFGMTHITGIVISIIATAFILDLPMKEDWALLAPWILYSLATPVTMAVGQGVMRENRNIHPMVLNFWGGFVAICLGIISIAFFDTFEAVFAAKHFFTIVWVSALIGVAVIALWVCNQLAYRGGVSIAVKKLVNNGEWLIFSLPVGALFFADTVTWMQGIGIVLFIWAFYLVRVKPA